MALQVWLPLNGDYNNYGLSGQLNFTETGTVSTVDGKIGKCKQFSLSNVIAPYSYTLGTEFSICAWVNWTAFPSSSSNDWIVHIATTSGYANAVVGLSYYHGTLLCVMAGGKNDYTYTHNFSTNTWYHIVFTWRDTGNSYLYINGQLVKTYTNMTGGTVKSADKISLGSNVVNSSTKFKGKLNDVRFYDHCLSPKEVHEIAKGLVLHYKLDDISLAQDNIFTNTDFSVRYSETRWNTEKNGTLLATGWNGYNSGVTNASENYHAHLKYLNGEYVYEYIKTSAEQWLGIQQSNLQSKLVAGQQYTFSWDQYCAEGTIYSYGGLYYYKTEVNSPSFGIGYFYGNSGRKFGVWQRFTYTFTAPTDGNYSKTMTFYIYGTGGGGVGTMYVRRFKLELGSTATPWRLAPSDSHYIARNTQVYDCSGYRNNGTIINTLITSYSSSRYLASTKFSNNAAIKVIDNNWLSQGMEQLTINVWVKASSWPTNTRIFSCTEAGGFNTEAGNSGYYRFPVYVYTNSGKTTKAYKYDSQEIQISALPTNQWCMLTFVYTIEGTKTYINGQLHHTYTNQSYGIYFNTNARLFIGCEANTATPASPYFTGEMSDFRIYATALSDKDILELYNTSALIDNKGNTYSYQFIEQKENLFTLENWREGCKYNLDYTTRNNEPALGLNASHFYYGSGDSRNLQFRGKFLPNTQYKFDLWIDADDVYYEAQNKNVIGGLMVYYTDGTNSGSTGLTILGDINNPIGWVHKVYYSTVGKSISGISVYYYIQTPAYYRWDSVIIPVGTDTQINENGNIITGKLRENAEVAQIGEGDNFDGNQLIEM